MDRISISARSCGQRNEFVGFVPEPMPDEQRGSDRNALLDPAGLADDGDFSSESVRSSCGDGARYAANHFVVRRRRETEIAGIAASAQDYDAVGKRPHVVEVVRDQ